MRFKGGGKQYPLSLGVIERTREGLLGKNFSWGVGEAGVEKMLSFFKGDGFVHVDRVVSTIKCFFGS